MRRLLAVAIVGALSLTAAPAMAASILFARVDDGYVLDANILVGYLTVGGNSVDTVNLNDTVISDFSSYSQVWVYDLDNGSNNSSNQQANYSNLANWYNNSSTQNLILDGRIISSSSQWTDDGYGLGGHFDGLGSGGEPEWIQNYATQLAAAGGGLVLGTDHFEYYGGINSINALIGVGLFNGNFNTSPYEAYVDPLSSLFIAGLETCASDDGKTCVNDNSSTSYVPTGLQANGQTLNAVAYHGTTSTAASNATIATTLGTLTPVPLPGAISLLGTGLMLLGFVGRRRRTA